MLSGAYSLVEINNILNAARSLLNVDEYQLLKLSHDKKIAEAFDQRMHLKLSSELLEAVELSDCTTAMLDELERDICPFNRNHLLTFLFTHYFQKGEVLNADSLSAINSWHILHAGLKKLSSSGPLASDAIEGLMLGFIGQLVKTGNLQTACAIHNYMHLGRKIALSKACGMGISNSAIVISSPLLEGLQLKERLMPEALAQEYGFMAKISEVLLSLVIFDEPFTPQAYTFWSLPKGSFYSNQAIILGAMSDPNALSVFKVNPDDVLTSQSKLAARLREGAYKTPLQARVVRFADVDDDEPLLAVTEKMADFSLVSEAALLKQFNEKRSRSKASEVEIIEVASLEASSSTLKKSRKASISISNAKK